MNVSTYTYQGSTVYVADVYADDVHALLAAFANDAYGHNVSATTSTIAGSNNALLAINGDCYGMRNAGYVVRNGVLYRSDSAGLSLKELATFMADELGVQCAYNLDGGGSSTMVYENTLVNKPATNGHNIQERGVTDIVYIAE